MTILSVGDCLIPNIPSITRYCIYIFHSYQDLLIELISKDLIKKAFQVFTLSSLQKMRYATYKVSLDHVNIFLHPN